MGILSIINFPMYLKINKTQFTRQQNRRKEISDIFNKTSYGLTSLLPFIISLFFAPALITSSLFSKEIVLMLANISLCLGYVSNFIYRLVQNEVSKSELLLSLLTIIPILTLSYFLYPAIASFTFINVLAIINQMAAGINFFFVVKHNIVPPLKNVIESAAQYMGFDIKANYYSKAPFTLPKDRYVLDSLLINTYNHDSSSYEVHDDKIKRFNNLLNKLCAYINKYDEALFGYFLNNTRIADLENQITLLTVDGNPDSSYTFIKKKIGWKKTKINLLEAAKKEVIELSQEKKVPSRILRFFSNVDQREFKNNPRSIILAGMDCLQKEIQRQKDKIKSLEECLPIVENHSQP